MTAQSAAPAWRGWLAIAAAASCWGAGGAVAAVLFRTSGLGPVAVTFWRFAIAAAACALLRPLRRSTAPVPEKRRSWRSAVLTGGGMAVSQVAFFGAVETAGVTLGTLLAVGAGPVLATVGGRYFLAEPVPRRGLIAIGAALAGVILLVTGSGHAGTGARPLLGVALALLCAVTYCAVTLLGRTGGGSGASLGAFIAGTVGLAPFAVRTGLWPHGSGPVHATGAGVAHGANVAQTVGWLLFLGLVTTLLAYRWYFAGLVTVPAAAASVIVLLEPVTAAAIGVGVLAERLTAPAAAGAGLLLVALVLLARTGGGSGGTRGTH